MANVSVIHTSSVQPPPTNCHLLQLRKGLPKKQKTKTKTDPLTPSLSQPVKFPG